MWGKSQVTLWGRICGGGGCRRSPSGVVSFGVSGGKVFKGVCLIRRKDSLLSDVIVIRSSSSLSRGSRGNSGTSEGGNWMLKGGGSDRGINWTSGRWSWVFESGASSRVRGSRVWCLSRQEAASREASGMTGTGWLSSILFSTHRISSLFFSATGTKENYQESKPLQWPVDSSIDWSAVGGIHPWLGLMADVSFWWD